MEEMTVLLHYIYQGSTRINQKNLPSFLQLAEDLKIEGLTRSEEKERICNTSLEQPKLIKTEEYLGIYDIETNEKDRIISSSEIKRSVSNFEEKRKKRKVSCTQVSYESPETKKELKGSDHDILDLSERTRMEENTNSYKEILPANAADNNFKGADPCIEDDRKFVPMQGKSKLDYVLEDVGDITGRFSPKLFPKVYCPVCKKMDGMSMDLKHHMRSKREVQCENCMLFFSNCNTLKVHLDGRCKFLKNKTS